jgi:hypothetical protein
VIPVLDLYKSKSPTQITDELSRYAWDNKNRIAREFVAEAWSEYANNPNPRSIALEIGKLIEAEYKRQFGGGTT